MATVVSVMDRPGWGANTDNIVVANANQRSLTWIPRDVWSPMLTNRINTAFRHGATRGGKEGGHEALIAAIVEQGLAADESLCLQRAAVAHALNDVSVQVPVETTLRFWYPSAPEQPIEDGRKAVEFNPPSEILAGERIHQWLGARYGIDRPSDDFDRMRRQQVFVRRLLEDGFDFARAVADPTLISVTSEHAFDELRLVNAGWRFSIIDDVMRENIEGKAVLVRAVPARRRGLRARVSGLLH